MNDSTSEQDNEQRNIALTSVKMVVLAIAMFGFCLFVMPPLYTLFCEITGINGKTKGKYEAVEAAVDTSRSVTIKFIATNNNDMPWQFAPKDMELVVHPGEAITTFFKASNPTGINMVGQAIPSLAPKNAISYFHKTECFCFNQQILQAGETAELGLQFIVDQDIPKNVHTIILSYTLFDVTDRPEHAELKESISFMPNAFELNLASAY